MKENHPNSKIITIFRSGSFLERAQGKDVAEHYAMSKVSIGAYWEGSGSRKVASGLSHEEEALLLPDIIDVTVEDRDFRKKVTEFYSELDTQVPYPHGVNLEIGLETDNNAPVSKKNFPINISDYVRYRQAQGHPFMAPNKEAADGTATKCYYIFDPTELKTKSANKLKEKDAAMAVYMKVKEEPAQVSMMLLLMGYDPREIKEDDRPATLRTLAETRAVDFFAIYQQENLETRAWVEEMIHVGVLKKLGIAYRDAETNKLIGNNLEETIYYFLDDAHSDEVLLYKARTQDASKTPVKKTSRKTQALPGSVLKN